MYPTEVASLSRSCICTVLTNIFFVSISTFRLVSLSSCKLICRRGSRPLYIRLLFSRCRYTVLPLEVLPIMEKI